jgi:cobalt-zinc-cadmium efflux system protein
MSKHDHNHHDHSHSHGGHHHAPPQSFNFAFGLAVLLNFAFTVFQATYAIIAGSMSLLADAAHNFGDVFGLVLAWGASWLLTLPARKRYSYGFKRTTIIAALSNALILVAGSALITYESIHKLLNLSNVNETIVIVVAIIGIVINGSTAMLFMKGAHDDLNIKGAFLHLMGDALISMGVVVSGILVLFTKQVWIDPLMGILIVVIILFGTWGLLRDSVSLILDAIPRHIDHVGIEEYLKKIPGVSAVHDLHIWGLSTKEVALTVHLIMPNGAPTDQEYQKINEDLKHDFRIDHATIQVETGSLEYPCNQIEPC